MNQFRTCFQWRSEHFGSGLFFNKRKGLNELSAHLENVLSEVLRHCAIFLIKYLPIKKHNLSAQCGYPMSALANWVLANNCTRW
jgi:hypothetical protein